MQSIRKLAHDFDRFLKFHACSGAGNPTVYVVSVL
jgi:hypothetical protein